MQRTIRAVALLAVLAAASTPAQSQESPAAKPDQRALLGEQDAKFFEEAAAARLAAIERAALAASTASNPTVKQFAQKVQQEKTRANEELQALARGKNVPLPAKPHADQQEDLAALKEKKGEEFDKTYLDQAVELQGSEVELFEKAAKDSTDPEIREHAARALPKLRELQLAGELLKKQTGRSTRPGWLPDRS